MTFLPSLFFFLSGLLSGVSLPVPLNDHFYTAICSCLTFCLSGFVYWWKKERGLRYLGILSGIGLVVSYISLYFLDTFYFSTPSSYLFIPSFFLFLLGNIFGMFSLFQLPVGDWAYLNIIPQMIGSYLSNLLFSHLGPIFKMVYLSLLPLLAISLFVKFKSAKQEVFTASLERIGLLTVLIIGMLSIFTLSLRELHLAIPLHASLLELFVVLVSSLCALIGNIIFIKNKMIFYIVGVVASIIVGAEAIVQSQTASLLLSLWVSKGFLVLLIFKKLHPLCLARDFKMVGLYTIIRGMFLASSSSLIFFFPGCLSLFLRKILPFLCLLVGFFSDRKLGKNEVDLKVNELLERRDCRASNNYYGVSTRDSKESSNYYGVSTRESKGSSNYYEFFDNESLLKSRKR